MDWTSFRAALLAKHHEAPQQAARIDYALRLAKEACDLLGSMGHQCHLALGAAPPSLWPRRMFHLQAAPRGHEVYCEEDIALLGEGWFATLDEAKHAAGMDKQFTRGGILPKRSLPTISSETELTPLDRENRRPNGHL